MQKYNLVQIMGNSRQATNLASKFNLVRTAIFTVIIPDEQVTTIRSFIFIPSESC